MDTPIHTCLSELQQFCMIHAGTFHTPHIGKPALTLPQESITELNRLLSERKILTRPGLTLSDGSFFANLDVIVPWKTPTNTLALKKCITRPGQAIPTHYHKATIDRIKQHLQGLTISPPDHNTNSLCIMCPVFFLYGMHAFCITDDHYVTTYVNERDALTIIRNKF